MSDQRHTKTVEPPLRITRIGDLAVIIKQLGHRAALKASQ